MADIAILVAEEYERRVKLAGKAGGAEGEYGIVQWVSSAAALAQGLRMKIGVEKMELAGWIREPKSQIGLAASNGFFSA